MSCVFKINKLWVFFNFQKFHKHSSRIFWLLFHSLGFTGLIHEVASGITLADWGISKVTNLHFAIHSIKSVHRHHDFSQCALSFFWHWKGWTLYLLWTKMSDWDYKCIRKLFTKVRSRSLKALLHKPYSSDTNYSHLLYCVWLLLATMDILSVCLFLPGGR